MNWKKINTEKDLPREGIYVIGKYNGDNWIDLDDQKNVNTVVVKLKKGLSIKEREKMAEAGADEITEKDGMFGKFITKHGRKYEYIRADQWGNNLVPYCWETFGTNNFFGQEITHWMPIPELKEE